MERYYLNYLRSKTEDPLVLKYIDMLKVEMDWRFYADGRDLDYEYHLEGILSLKWRLYYFLTGALALIGSNKTKDKQLLTAFRFPCQLEGYKFFSSLIHPFGYKDIVGDINTLRDLKFSEKINRKYPFNRVLTPEVIARLEACEENLYNLCFNKNNFRALFLYTDQYFWTKQLISVFKKANKPSFIFVHGLPPYYPTDADNKTDYLMVWGEKMKQNYIDGGFDSSKIKVIGNFRYKDVHFFEHLRNTLDDVLVVTTSTKIWHQDTWNSTPTISDPSATLLYLLQIENVLKGLGVKHARLRPHPSVRKQWLNSIIDDDFYHLDTEPLSKSLQRSTLVIGPTSTVSMEAIMNGVNYIVYEPCDERGYNFVNRKLAPPFDGTDKYLCVANTEEDLIHQIKGGYCSSSELLKEYMQPFNPHVIKELI